MSSDNLIGFVGLGNIGLPMSRNMMSNGLGLLGFDLVKNESFVSAGGEFADSLDQLAAESDVIVQSLPTMSAVNSSVSSIAAHADPGTIVIDLSSYPLAEKKANFNLLNGRGITLLDCEVSGLPHMVAQRKAVIFQSGDRAAIDAVAHVFDAMTDKCYYLGDFGASTNMKLFANAMVCVHNAIGAEILNLAAASGIDQSLVYEVLRESAAGSNTFTNKAPIMISRDFEHGVGPFRHMFHYLARVSTLAENTGVQTPLVSATKAIYDRAEDLDMHDKDIAAIIQLFESSEITTD